MSIESRHRDQQIAEALKAAGKEIAIAVTNARETCLTCEHFDQKAEGCALAGGARPPARVIAFGCDSYLPEIPF